MFLKWLIYLINIFCIKLVQLTPPSIQISTPTTTKVFKTNNKETQNLISSLLQDPRKNSSFYDIVLKENVKYNSIIGSINDILIQKKQINKSSLVFKYKLIYYSPQLIPTSLLNSNNGLSLGSSNQNSSFSRLDNQLNIINGINSETLFSVDLNNGSVYIKTPNEEPILEYLCIKRPFCSCFSCIFTLNIIYSTENKINADTIRVFIDDSNDFVPKFLTNLNAIEVNVSESSQIGDSFRLFNATAIDSDAYYNQVTYYLSDKDIQSHYDDKTELRSNLFDISTTNDESNDLNLILKTHLDYETSSIYELYLIAQDNGYPNRFKNSKRLLVNVIDENDHSPVCEKSLFIETIKENKMEKKFLQIKATDLDSGLNGKLHYSLHPNASQVKLDDLFEIDEQTGWLSLKQTLDYEKKSFYELKIQIQDSGLFNQFKTICNARINVIDLNDNPAKMKIIKYLNESIQSGYYSLNTMSDSNVVTNDMHIYDGDNGGYSLTMDEYLALNTNENRNQIELYENNKFDLVLALIRVFDRDTLSNYRFSIQSATNGHEDISMFEIRQSDRSNREFELITNSRLDSEKIQSYRLKIYLYDLEDLNSVELNGQFSYGSSNLMISKKPSKLDENEENNFQIVLFERVKVLDLNDNGPKFLKSYYEFSIDENMVNVRLTPKNYIGAYDLDTSKLNSKLRYKIIDKNNLTSNAMKHISLENEADFTNDAETIDTDALGDESGDDLYKSNNYPSLFIKAPFDYEIDGSLFEFNLVVYDIDNHTDTAVILIRIQDVNDNPPIFMNNNSTFTIKENMLSSSFVGQVIAIDKDSTGSNSDVSFRIISEFMNNLFKIYKSGVISNKVIFDREEQSVYALKIEAYDSGRPSMSSIGIFYVKIEDENDNKPVFVYPNEHAKYLCIKITNDQTYDQLKLNRSSIKLFSVKATDSDLDANNSKVLYFIEDSLDLLKIDKINGTVYLDIEKLGLNSTKELCKLKQVLKLSLTAKDSGFPIEQTTTINLTFYLNYERHEMPVDLIRAIQSDPSRLAIVGQENDLNLSKKEYGEYLRINSYEKNVQLNNDATTKTILSEKSRNFFQIISNSVLIIILLVVLLFMIFIACFVLITAFKRTKRTRSSSCSSKPAKKRKKRNNNNNGNNNNQEITNSNNNTITYPSNSSETNNGNNFFSYLNQIRLDFKISFNLSRFISIFNIRKHNCFNGNDHSSHHEQNLTVKDASSSEIKSTLDRIDSLIGNSFKVTIKNMEQITQQGQHQQASNNLNEIIKINQRNTSSSSPSASSSITTAAAGGRRVGDVTLEAGVGTTIDYLTQSSDDLNMFDPTSGIESLRFNNYQKTCFKLETNNTYVSLNPYQIKSSNKNDILNMNSFTSSSSSSSTPSSPTVSSNNSRDLSTTMNSNTSLKTHSACPKDDQQTTDLINHQNTTYSLYLNNQTGDDVTSMMTINSFNNNNNSNFKNLLDETSARLSIKSRLNGLDNQTNLKILNPFIYSTMIAPTPPPPPPPPPHPPKLLALAPASMSSNNSDPNKHYFKRFNLSSHTYLREQDELLDEQQTQQDDSLLNRSNQVPPIDFSDNQFSLSEPNNTNNTSEILQNLLQKFERFYNDSLNNANTSNNISNLNSNSTNTICQLNQNDDLTLNVPFNFS